MLSENSLRSALKITLLWIATILSYIFLFRVVFDIYVSLLTIQSSFNSQPSIIVSPVHTVGASDKLMVIVYRWGILPVYFNGFSFTYIHLFFFLSTIVLYIIWGIKKYGYTENL